MKPGLPLACLFAGAMLTLAGASATAANAAACEQPSRLRFALIPQGDAEKDLAQLQPLFDELKTALGMPVETFVPSSYGGAVEALLSGSAHLGRLGPASYVSARRQDPMLTPFATYSQKANAYQDEGPFYHSVLVARSDGRFASTAALRGMRLSLVDPESTSGSLVPRHQFAREVGSGLGDFFSSISYAGNHAHAIARVLKGQADAAFVGSSNLAAFIRDEPQAREELRVLWRSSPIPLDPFVYRGQLCGALKDRIRAVFLGRSGTGNKALLSNLEAIRFVAIRDEDYRVIREIHAIQEAARDSRSRAAKPIAAQ